jgi:hypothetical protein
LGVGDVIENKVERHIEALQDCDVLSFVHDTPQSLDLLMRDIIDGCNNLISLAQTGFSLKILDLHPQSLSVKE